MNAAGTGDYSTLAQRTSALLQKACIASSSWLPSHGRESRLPTPAPVLALALGRAALGGGLLASLLYPFLLGRGNQGSRQEESDEASRDARRARQHRRQLALGRVGLHLPPAHRTSVSTPQRAGSTSPPSLPHALCLV
jgi:hypothetical protein